MHSILLSHVQDLVPYLPLFTRALSEFGTKKEDFVSLTQRIKRKVQFLFAAFLHTVSAFSKINAVHRCHETLC